MFLLLIIARFFRTRLLSVMAMYFLSYYLICWQFHHTKLKTKMYTYKLHKHIDIDQSVSILYWQHIKQQKLHKMPFKRFWSIICSRPFTWKIYDGTGLSFVLLSVGFFGKAELIFINHNNHFGLWHNHRLIFVVFTWLHHIWD